MKKRLLQTLLLLAPLLTNAQGPGSIAFLGYQTNAPDGFTFVNLQALAPNTVIYFTDNGWDGSALFSNENTLTWTSPSTTLAAGSIMYIYNSASDVGLLDGPGSVTGELPNLSSSGDQVLAYSGSSSNPTFLAAISNTNFAAVCAISGAPVNNATCLPASLTLGENAQVPTNSETPTTNMFFNIGSFTGTPNELLDAIMNNSNWTSSNDINVAGAGQWPGWNFNVNPPAPASVSIVSGNLDILEGAAASTITINLSAPAFGTQTLSVNISGNITSADVETNPAGSSNAIPISIPSGATSVTFTLSALADGTTEGSETGTLTLTNLSSGLVVGSPSNISIEINEPSDVSIVSFQDASLQLNETDGASTFNLLFEPATNSEQSITFSLSYSANLTNTDFLLYPEQTQTFTVTIPAGVSDFSFDFVSVEDNLTEADETLTIIINSTSSALIVGTQQTVDVTILENDQELLPQQLFINEVQASNVNDIEVFSGIHSDWIEIYNASNQPVDLAGLYLSDDENDPYKFQFPAGFSETIIPANGFILAWADDSTEAGPMHLNFKISSLGEKIGIYGMANQAVTLDTITLPELFDDQSFGALSDGGNVRVVFPATTTTPGLSNIQSGILETNPTSGILMFPVPASDYLTCVNNQHSNCEIEIFSVSGVKISDFNLQGNQTTTINTSILSSGVYFLVSRSESSIVRTPFIVQH
jgi:hypothetical protein